VDRIHKKTEELLKNPVLEEHSISFWLKISDRRTNEIESNDFFILLA